MPERRNLSFELVRDVLKSDYTDLSAHLIRDNSYGLNIKEVEFDVDERDLEL